MKLICGLVGQQSPLQKSKSTVIGKRCGGYAGCRACACWWRHGAGGVHLSWCTEIIHLGFVHFCVCVLHFNKEFKIKTTILRHHFHLSVAKLTTFNKHIAGEGAPCFGELCLKVSVYKIKLWQSNSTSRDYTTDIVAHVQDY